jgi:hypothetical protein
MKQNVALLNPQVESAVCQRMIEAVTERKDRLDRDLTANVLDRENYLLKIGAARELEQLLVAMNQLYEREFKV